MKLIRNLLKKAMISIAILTIIVMVLVSIVEYRTDTYIITDYLLGGISNVIERIINYEQSDKFAKSNTDYIVVEENTKSDLKQLNSMQINNVIRKTTGINQIQQEVTEHAVSLVGKVNYFWGGKSFTIGFDDRWGEVREITDANSDSTGQLEPYGLDCSGYISWLFYQLGYSEGEVDRLIGSGTWNQWDKSTEIEWNELVPGDLVFQYIPGEAANHVGICIGYFENEPVFAHCAAMFDNVVVTKAGDVFKYARRPSTFNY